MNGLYGTNITIVKKGQLEFALEKPKMVVFGHEQYPELYQKAAALMESITKTHPLSDGNKRTAMIAAEIMVAANGGELVLPLKSTRLSVATAMDKNDDLSETVQKWFGVHVATNASQLCFMLQEIIEEESILKRLATAQKYREVEDILSLWMAFDNYPEKKKAWQDLLYELEGGKKDTGDGRAPPGSGDPWPDMWDMIQNMAGRDHCFSCSSISPPVTSIRDLRYYDNSYEELIRAESSLKDAESEFEGSVKLDVMHKKAMLLQYGGKYGDALSEFKRMEAVRGDAPGSSIHVGNMLSRLGRHEEARDYWRLFLNLNPGSIPGLCHYAATLEKLGEYEEGLSVCQKVLASEGIDPAAGGRPDPDAGRSTRDSILLTVLLTRALCLVKLDRGRDAVKALGRIAALEPSTVLCYEILGTIAMAGRDYKTAIHNYDRVIRLAPHKNTTYYNKALAVHEMNGPNDDRLLGLYKKSMELNPNHAKSWIGYGYVLRARGRPREAVPYLERGLEIKPYKTALLYLGYTMVDLGSHDSATRYFDRILSSEPGHGDALFGKSMALAEMNGVLECLECLEGAVRTDPAYKNLAKGRHSGRFANVRDSKKFQKLVA